MTIILDDYKKEIGQPKPSSNRTENNTSNNNGKHEYQFQTPCKSSKKKKADTNKDFSSKNRLEILQDDIKKTNKKKKDHDLNENDPADNNNSDSIKDKEIKNLVQKHKNKNSYNSYFRRFDIKIKINMCIPFERLQNVRRTLL